MDGKARSRRLSESGIEELNLVEFPIAVLADHPPTGQKTIEFQDSVEDSSTGNRVPRKCIVTGSDKWGLPNWFDMDVVLALMKLTKDQHNWRDRLVTFSLYELCNLLQFPRTNGWYIPRLQESLLRIKATTICYQNGWRRNGKWNSTEAFSLLDNVRLTNTKEFYDSDESQCLKWNDLVVESMQASHSKGIDWDFYLSLQKPVTKRLFRFLDKRFQIGTKFTYVLSDFCENKLGMKAGQPAWRLRQSLDPAITELVTLGFPVDDQNLYSGRGKNSSVTFLKRPPRKSKAATPKQDTKVATGTRTTEPTGLEQALLDRGITNATELVTNYPADRIEQAIENFDHRNKHGEDKGPGWLRTAIESENGFGFRKDYRSKEQIAAEQKRLAKIRQEQEQQRARDEAARKKDEEQEARAFAAFMENLGGPAEQEAFFQEALESGAFGVRFYHKAVESNDAQGIELYRETILKDAMRKRLSQQ